MNKKYNKEFYEDEYGYIRENNHSNAWHRKVAYHKIYLKNRKKYKLPFSKYEIHHIDGDKKNNLIGNLALLTTEEHIDLHQIIDKKGKGDLTWKEACSDAWYEFTIEKEAKREREYLESLESQEEVYKYLLKKAGVEFEEGSIGLLMDEDEEFIKEVLTFYRVTGRKITKKEVNEIVGNKEEFKNIIKEQEEKKKKKVEEEMLRRYNTKKKEVQERHKNNLEKPIKTSKEKKRGWKKYFFIGIIVLVIILIGYFALNNENKRDAIKNYPKENPNINLIPEQPKVEPIIVTGSKTDVIIKNNQQKSVSLNVTYRIYSNWFGKDSTESSIFEIEAGEEKSFKVYNNDGCSTAPCSVSIINFKEVGL